MSKRTSRRSGSSPVSSIMTRRVAVVRDSLSVESLTKFLLEHGITSAAVSDEYGTLVGHVSMIDLVRERYLNGETEEDASARKQMRRESNENLRSGFHLEPAPRARVSDIMMPFVLRLSERASIDEAAAVMAREGVHRILVVSESNTVVGIVSALDVLKWLAKRDGYAVSGNEGAQWRSSCEYATA
jgi:predicted transcriptional regulator